MALTRLEQLQQKVEQGEPLTDAELKAYIKAWHEMIAAKLTRKLRAELGLD